MYKIHPLKAYTHWKIASLAEQYSPETVLDMGGTGRLKSFLKAEITDANIRNGIDATDLPYKNGSFDVAVSIDTVEHVKDKVKFFKESIRVARKAVIHYFLYGTTAEIVEHFKAKLGHKHPFTPITGQDIVSSFCPKDIDYYMTRFITATEHLLLLTTINNKLNHKEIFKFINELSHSNKNFYGIIIEGNLSKAK